MWVYIVPDSRSGHHLLAFDGLQELFGLEGRALLPSSFRYFLLLADNNRRP